MPPRRRRRPLPCSESSSTVASVNALPGCASTAFASVDDRVVDGLVSAPVMAIEPPVMPRR